MNHVEFWFSCQTCLHDSILMFFFLFAIEAVCMVCQCRVVVIIIVFIIIDLNNAIIVQNS